jgi:DNA-binding FadR family transcriptional regulator
VKYLNKTKALSSLDMSVIVRKSLAEEVSIQLQEQIIKGIYRVGQKIPVEAELMKLFGVGRSTIREAIKLLSQSGHLLVQQGRGTFVGNFTSLKEPFDLKITSSSFSDIQELSGFMEAQIVNNASQNRIMKDLSKLKTAMVNCAKVLKNGDIEIYLSAHFNYYLTLAEAGKNPVVLSLYELLAPRLLGELKSRNHLLQVYERNFECYLKLFKSILDKDAVGALEWHYRITENLYPAKNNQVTDTRYF